MSVGVSQRAFDLSQAEAAKERLGSVLARVRATSEALGSETASALAQQAQAALKQEIFRIVVVGEFSRGKSTLINALLGAKVLPTGIQPVTAIITSIHYSESPIIELRMKTGEVSEIAAAEFLRLVAAAEPAPGSEIEQKRFRTQTAAVEGIESARIGNPCALCRNGVEIIDTPGTNDLNAARERVTFEFIPQADAVLFVLSAIDCIGSSEMQFLTERVLAADIQRIFFLLNFADLLPREEERRRVEEYVRQQLRGVVASPRLRFVAAKPALRQGMNRDSAADAPEMDVDEHTGLPGLKRDLAAFLIAERLPAKMAKPIALGRRSSETLRLRALPIARSGLEASARQIANRIAEVNIELTRVRRQRDAIVRAFRSNAEAAIAGQLPHLEQRCQGIAKAAGRAVRNHDGPLTKEAMKRSVERAVAPLETAFQAEVEAATAAAIGEAFGRTHAEVEAALARLAGAVASDGGEPPLYLDVSRRSWRAAALSFLAQFAPENGLLGVIGSAAAEHMVKLFSPLVSKYYNQRGHAHMKAINENWRAMIQECADRLTLDSDCQLRDLQGQLKMALAQASDHAESRARRQADLDGLERELRDAEHEIASLSEELEHASQAAIR